jgi:hypothetical protein
VIGPTQRPLPDNRQHPQQTDINAPSWIRTHNPSKRSAADSRHRPWAIGISNCLCLLSHKIHELTACEITVLYNNIAVSCAPLTFKEQPKHVEGTVLLYILYCKLLALLIRNIWRRTECATINYLVKDCNINRYITWQLHCALYVG